MIKTILVPAGTGSNADMALFSSALAVARAFDAHMEVLHVRVDAAAVAANMAADGSGAAVIGGLIEQIESEASQQATKAEQRFQEFCKRERVPVLGFPGVEVNLSAQWVREVGNEPHRIAEYGRSADLLVIGRPGDDQSVSLDTIETALLASGRPVLIPAANPLSALPETIVIAWKAAPEAARAVTAAMPFLAKTKQIQILTVAEEQGISDEEGARLMTSLRRHGLQASARHLKPERVGAAETLLAAAAEFDALVVMGAYGHTRLHEWMFGGFTRHVLRGSAVPVLMMH